MSGFSKQEIMGSGNTSPQVRQQMVAKLRMRGVSDERVLDFMSKLPRHLFVDQALAAKAYSDDALPIGYGQTISQPFIVARMTEELIRDLPARAKILEVGTGSGYQAALLACLAAEVYSVERIEGLYLKTAKLLAAMGFKNIHTQHSDGGWGWQQQAPFDAIMVTAAPASIPQELLLQLKINGRLVIPVGSQEQRLTIVERHDENQFSSQTREDVRFVPFLGGAV